MLSTSGPADYSYRRIFSELQPYRLRLALGTFCLLIAAPAGLIHPLVWMFVVDEVLVGGKLVLLVPALAAMVIVHVVFSILLGALRDRLFEAVGVDFCRDLRNRVYRKLNSQPIGYLNRQRTGDLMSRVIADVDAMQGSMLHGLTNVLQEGAAFLVVLIAICSLNWKIGLATFLPLFVVFLIVRAYTPRVRQIHRASRELLGQLGSKLQDNLAGMLVTKAFAQEQAEEQRFEAQTDRHAAKLREGIKLRATVFPLAHLIGFTTNAIMLGMGAWLVVEGEFTLGGLVALRGYWWQLNGPIKAVAQISDILQRLQAAGQRVYAILDAPVELVDASAARPLTQARAPLHLRNVTFAYEPARPPVLANFSCTIRPGERLALAGASGAGKSTLLYLLARFYDPQGGEILWGEQPLRSIAQGSWRPHLGMVLQDTFLFHESLRANILYGRPQASDAEVVIAARRANAHDFIAALPHGYESVVGERGVKLSGGQRQRIGVARAFLSNPEVLLLDEPTSSVEPESEEIIQQSLLELMEGRTVVLTSHRPSLLARADRVLMLDGTGIVEDGSPQELLTRGGPFAEMYRGWQESLNRGPVR